MKQILLLLLIPFSLSAQVKGIVLDSISGKPIEYVGIFTSKAENNFSSDKKGKFKIENLTAKDTLWFFTTGYEEKKVAFKDLSKNIYLKPISHFSNKDSDELYNDKKKWIDFQTSNPTFFKTTSSYSASLKAYFMEGINSANKSIILDKLSFKVVNLTAKTNFLKVRFFKADSSQNIAEEILIEPIIVEVESSEFKESNNVYHSKGFIEIDVLAKQIEIPTDGFFIALESINIEENQFKSFYSEGKSILISPSINSTNIETKVYSYSKGKWQKVEKANFFPDFKISIATTKN